MVEQLSWKWMRIRVGDRVGAKPWPACVMLSRVEGRVRMHEARDWARVLSEWWALVSLSSV